MLLDLNMPVVNGFEALPELRRRLPEAKVFILTTGQAPQERERALDAGAHGFIVKPERVFTLDDALRGALAESGGAPQGISARTASRISAVVLALPRYASAPAAWAAAASLSSGIPEMSSTRAAGAAARSRGTS